MLFITTRSNHDAFTAHKAMVEDFAPDGGGYVPFQMPKYDRRELEVLSGKHFSECIATILNGLFASKISGWDVEFAIGRNPIKLVELNSRIVVAQLCANPDNQFSYFTKALYQCVLQGKVTQTCTSRWFEISVRIAILFAIWTDLLKRNTIAFDDVFDISISCENLYTFIASLYAQKMGLPVRTTVLACAEGSPFWELINRGKVKPDSFNRNESDVVERMLQCILDCEEANRYVECRGAYAQFVLTDEACTEINRLVFTAPVSASRVAVTIGNVAKKDGYNLLHDTACAYGGLEDFRSRLGTGKYALIIAESRS